MEHARALRKRQLLIELQDLLGLLDRSKEREILSAACETMCELRVSIDQAISFDSKRESSRMILQGRDRGSLTSVLSERPSSSGNSTC